MTISLTVNVEGGSGEGEREGEGERGGEGREGGGMSGLGKVRKDVFCRWH